MTINHFDFDSGVYIPVDVRYYFEEKIILVVEDSRSMPSAGDLVSIEGKGYICEIRKFYPEELVWSIGLKKPD